MDRRKALQALAGAGAAVALSPKKLEAREAKKPAEDALGLLFDATRCIGCQTCVHRCKKANGVAPPAGALTEPCAELGPDTRTVVQRADVGGKERFIKRQCMHCVDPACVSACMLGALTKGPKGAVVYDAELCVGCRYCQVVCPFEVPRFEWSSATPRIVKCELCTERQGGGGPACAENCPSGALKAGPLKALRAEAQARLKAAPNRYLPEVYGLKEVGGTQVLYLSGVDFGKLGLPGVSERSLPALSETIQHGIYRGFALPLVLYGALAAVLYRNRKKGGATPGDEPRAGGRQAESTDQETGEGDAEEGKRDEP